MIKDDDSGVEDQNENVNDDLDGEENLRGENNEDGFVNVVENAIDDLAGNLWDDDDFDNAVEEVDEVIIIIFD